MPLTGTDNATQGVSVPASSFLNDLGQTVSVTVCFVITTTSVSNAARNICGKVVVNGGFEIFKRAADGTMLRLSCNDVASGATVDVTSGSLIANIPTFWAVTFNKASASWAGAAAWYRGFLVGPGRLTNVTGTVSAAPTTPQADSGANLNIMGSTAGASGWPGVMSHFSIYQPGLTFGQVRDLYDDVRQYARMARGFWNLGELGSGLQPDLSGHGGVGTVTGLTFTRYPDVPDRLAYRRRVRTFFSPPAAGRLSRLTLLGAG